MSQPSGAALFGQEAKRFVDHVESIRATVPLLVTGMSAVAAEEKQGFEQYISSSGIEQTPETESRVTYHVPAEHYGEFRHWLRRLNHITLAQRVFPRSFIVTLVSQFDALVGGLIRAMYTVHPEKLSSSEKQLTFSQLVTFRNLDEAREYIIEREVETVLRDSHAEQFAWLERKLDVPLRKGLESWPTFIELTERRNLFVHTEGRVSRQYLQVCGTHGVPLNGVELNSRLRVPGKYFVRACDCVTELGVKLAHVMWRKLLPDDLAAADASLNSLALDLIQHGNHSLAENLFAFATETLKKHSDEHSKLIFVLNRAQALKWMGRQTDSEKVLSAVDWSAKSDILRLGRAVLLDLYDEAANLMRRIGRTPPVTELSYRDWPIFSEFRERPEFLDAYRSIFGQEFAVGTEEVSSDEELLTDAVAIPTDIDAEPAGHSDD